MPNRLSSETSPYLLQHAENPVDWYAWGEEALTLARVSDRPILLSIGYSACHWCHVMEHESFSDPDVARIMNRDFVCIKVDREERPDIDSVYMTAVQAMTGAGGWPLTAFLKPDGVPFYGGTYFPPEPRHRLPSFRQVLNAASDAYRNRREALDQAGAELLNVLSGGRHSGSSSPIRAEVPTEETTAAVLGRAVETAGRSFDAVHGGFGSAPKFPQPVLLDFLLRQGGSRSYPVGMATQTLGKMAAGGLRDHLAGGFHRYSVDAVWLVPHFEKMLYDNALLARAFAFGHIVTGDPFLKDVAEETVDYVLSDLRSPEGAFYSARDADSEGVEGRFYVWDVEEVHEVLGSELGDLFCKTYDVSPGGNFEGRNILHLPHDLGAIARAEGLTATELDRRLADARAQLLGRRAMRPEPMRDEKVIASWNGMMIRTLAEAGAGLGRSDYIEAGVRSAEAVLEKLFREGDLFRIWAGGRSHVLGFLEDYASMGNACLSLYEATLAPRWLEWARTLAEAAVDRFWDPETERFFDTSPAHEDLVVRPRDIMDNAVPSGNSLVVELLLRLGTALSEAGKVAMATKVLSGEGELMNRFPTAVARLLVAGGWVARSPVEIVIVGTDSETKESLEAVHQTFLPERVVVGGDPSDNTVANLPLMAGRTGHRGLVYVCRANACLAPAKGADEITERLTTVAAALETTLP